MVAPSLLIVTSPNPSTSILSIPLGPIDERTDSAITRAASMFPRCPSRPCILEVPSLSIMAVWPPIFAVVLKASASINLDGQHKRPDISVEVFIISWQNTHDTSRREIGEPLGWESLVLVMAIPEMLIHQVRVSVGLFRETIVLRDLIRINQPLIGKEEIDAATEVLKSGILTEKSGMGPRVLEFEKDFAKYVGAKHAVAVNTGTAALHCALLVAGVKAGDEVIIPSFTFHATAEVVLMTGAEPVFADIDPDTYTVTAETVEAAMTRNTKAIMPVHIYGLPAELDPIKKVARERGVALIEDAAQAHGAEYKGSRIGSIGDLSCFSFYAGKNMTTGEGGMVTTNDDDYSERLRMLRSHGEQRPYWPVSIGNN